MPSEANVKKAATEFAGKITSRLTEFQRIVPSFSDPDLTNRFLEAQVRSLIEECLAPKRMLSGVFSVPGASSPTAAPSHIEGAVHDPERGQPTFEQGSFCVINPATCVGLIQIKPTVANVSKFQNRLGEIAQTFFFGRRPGMVMGILVSDVAAEKKSIVHRFGKTFPTYQFTHPKWCPMFILFSRRDGLFEPYSPAIEALVANLNRVG
jgi:hypothetical protein